MSQEITVKPHTDSNSTSNLPDTVLDPTVVNRTEAQDATPYLILSAGGLLASFFLPWVTILFSHPSGFDLQKLGDLHRAYWVVPALAAIAILSALAKTSQRPAAQFAGAAPYLILVYWLFQAGEGATHLLSALNYGAYLALVCGFCLQIIALRFK